MDVDDSAVDLSVRSLPPELSELRALTASGLTITPAQPPPPGSSGRRVLRPRAEQRSYVESPDIVLLPAKPPHVKTKSLPVTPVNTITPIHLPLQSAGATQAVGFPGLADAASCDNLEDEELSSDNDENDATAAAAIMPLRELSSAEIWERERHLRGLREKLRAEETKLVLLRKIRQSQQSLLQHAANKDSAATINPVSGLTTVPGGKCVVPAGVTLTPAPPPAHQHHHSSSASKRNSSGVTQSVCTVAPNVATGRSSSLPGGATLTPGPYRTQSSSSGNSASITPSVTITPAPPPVTAAQHTPAPPAHSQPVHTTKASSRSNAEDTQSPAQRQAAAKLALRKQLEKTLLQIPPPKPPPPEMHFIPSPSNTDFVYLVGLEHVVDYLTTDDRMARPAVPPCCAQCGADFTPVWRWERPPTPSARRADATFHAAAGAARVLCEQCVSGNVKRALKAEHTARLKMAFVRALQQEQEIERKLAAAPSPPPTPAPPPAAAPPPPPPPARPAQMTVSRSVSRGPPPPAPSTPAPAPSKPSLTVSASRSHSSEPLRSHHTDRSSERAEITSKKSSSSSSGVQSSGSSKQHQQQQLAAAAAAQMAFEQHSAAAMQALQHQLFRGLSAAAAGGGMTPAAAAAAMMQFSPLLYPYQLAMAQAAGLGKSSKSASSGTAASTAAAASNPAQAGLSMVELQRAAELQRQYLIDMLPSGGGAGGAGSGAAHGGRGSGWGKN